VTHARGPAEEGTFVLVMPSMGESAVEAGAVVSWGNAQGEDAPCDNGVRKGLRRTVDEGEDTYSPRSTLP
jgi:hypothetical protein